MRKFNLIVLLVFVSSPVFSTTPKKYAGRQTGLACADSTNQSKSECIDCCSKAHLKTDPPGSIAQCITMCTDNSTGNDNGYSHFFDSTK